eukprot:SAG31_NODE_12839_length_913_cov_0.998771_2_plen_60_part_01
MVFDANGSMLISAGGDGRVLMWSVSNGRFIKEFVRRASTRDAMEPGGGEITHLVYRPTTQ